MRNLSRKFIALIAGFVAFGIPAVAQNPAVFGGAANAYAFAYGINPLVAPLQVDQTAPPSVAGVATLTVAFGTVALGDGTIITPLSTSAPITIGTGANAETVTPSAVSCSNPTVYQSCSFTATFSNPHGTGDKISSASFGLQEAAGFVVGKGGGLVILSPAWFKRYASIAAGRTAIATFNSLGSTYHVLDYSGNSTGTTTTAAHSWFNATAGSAYAATTIVLY